MAANEGPSHSNDRILASLQNRFIQAYLQFFGFQLEYSNAFNRLFQSERPLLQNLKQEVESLVKSITNDFMKVSIVKTTQPKNLDPADVQLHVPLRHTYFGLGASATLQQIEDGATKEDVEKFLTDCKNFLIESIRKIQRRFDLESEIYEIVQCLLPSNAASVTPHSLGRICLKLPSFSNIIDVNKLDREWRQHPI